MIDIDGKHFSEGAYDRIAAKLFNDLNVSTYYLEYDTPRAGGFEPLKHLPKNKNVVLGVVTSKFPKLEDQKEMVERVYKAADYVAKGSGQSREEALQRLCVSPQCGFASHAEGNPLGYEVRSFRRSWVEVSCADRSTLAGHEEETAARPQHC